jgi:hypothetical protein
MAASIHPDGETALDRPVDHEIARHADGLAVILWITRRDRGPQQSGFSVSL